MPRCWVNGYYAGNNTCRCLEGYQLARSEGGTFMCLPDCGDSCGAHARCEEPGSCQCVQGYRDKRSGDDFERNAPIRCEPICVHGCGSGKCVAPGTCQCGRSSRWSTPYNCTNAICHRWYWCECWPGYEQVAQHSTACRPQCQRPCGNGTCIAPGQCDCWQGYELSKGVCVPKCKTNCGYGKCVAPDQCECWPDNELVVDEAGLGRCEPVCRPPCGHGTCEPTGRCDCWEGYRYNGTATAAACEPVCTRPCINADCVEPDTCRCWDGFGPAPGNGTGSVCEPTCNATCVNATCTAPNTCTCLEGLVHDSADPNGATCALPCPDQLCSQQVLGGAQDECLLAAARQDCVCAKGSKRPLCSRAAASPRGQVPWPVVMLLPPGLAVVALVAYICVRKRRSKSATGDVPPQRLSSTASGGTSDEYEDVSGYYRPKFPVDTKKLIKRGDKCKAQRSQSGEELTGMSQATAAAADQGRHSPAYCEVAPRDSRQGPGGGGPGQMAENDFYGDPGGSEWSRASVLAIHNDLYSQQGQQEQPQRNTLAPADLADMYARVVKKADRRSSAKIVDNDFYGQPSRNRQQKSCGEVARGQEPVAERPEGHYEQVADGTPAEVDRPEEQHYEEISDRRSKASSEMVDNALYRPSDSCEEVADYAEIVNDASRGPGKVVENTLYGQVGDDSNVKNAMEQHKSRNLHVKGIKGKKGHKKT